MPSELPTSSGSFDCACSPLRDLHATILHVRMRADVDGMHVAAQNGIHPDAGVLAEHYISDDLGRRIHIAGIRNGRHDAFVRADHSEYRKRLNITCAWGGK